MKKVHSGIAVPRHFVFITADGAFVVQLSESRVQDLLTGQFLTLRDENYGHGINDYELNQLKVAGRVEHYNRNYVWLNALPEPHTYEKRTTQERLPDRARFYYINTTLPKSKINVIQGMLAGLGLSDNVLAVDRGDLVAILGKSGKPFAELNEAETIQKELTSRAPHLFEKSVIAFIEMASNDGVNQEIMQITGLSDLATIIASQSDTSVTEHKEVILLLDEAHELAVIRDLCLEMKMNVRTAQTATEALHFLEDKPADLLVMDLQLPDMHGWEMLGKVREIDKQGELPIIVIAEHSMPNQKSLALTVAKVDVYLVKPVSLALLRQNIWIALKDRSKS